MSLNFGLTVTSIVAGISLAVALIIQFNSKKYVPSIYWLSVFLISIFGTLVTDNLTDSLGVPLELSTIIFSILLALTFAVWYIQEKTLSIHSIFTWQRESFYWLAILFTFALGTAAGDLLAESLGLGYLVTGIIVCFVILCTVIAWKLGLDNVLSFWVVYIMTRPLGASLGDYLSQSPANGGLGWGPTVTTVLFVSAIGLTVLFLTFTKKDQITTTSFSEKTKKSSYVFLQVFAVIGILLIAGVSGYFFRQSQLQASIAASGSSTAPLGDLSAFKIIIQDTLTLVQQGKLADAKTRVGDLEFAWDNAEAHLKPMNSEDWYAVDDAIDTVLRQLRSVHQDQSACQSSLESLLDLLNSFDLEENGESTE